MTDMKMSPEEMTSAAPAAAADKPDYPYGLRVHLDEASIKKLGLKALPEVKSNLSLEAVCRVIGSGTNSAEDGTNRFIELQICSMELGPASQEQSEEDAEKKTDKLYSSQSTPTGSQ